MQKILKNGFSIRFNSIRFDFEINNTMYSN
jgi:hypothetical protein